MGKFGSVKSARAGGAVPFGSMRRKQGALGEYPVPPKPKTQASQRAGVTVKPPGKQTAGPLFVQGQPASDLEERTYRMLKMLGWTDQSIVFQTPILGGRRPGGQVLDFVLYGFGTVSVLFVNGDYWHGVGLKAQETLYKEDQVRRVMPAARVFSLFTGDLVNDEVAFLTLQRLVGRGA